MNVMPEMPEIPRMPEMAEVSPDAGVVSVYDNPIDEFPVLKAFQQYIDAEQTKARKRLMSLGIFFGFLMVFIIGVFVYLLSGANIRNQQLNDKLLDFVMNERERPQQVVSTPDNSAVEALAAKIEEMQKKFEEALSKQRTEESERAQKAAEEAAAAQKAAIEQIRTQESEEIIRLKALLDAEKQKNAEERQRAEEERKRIREEELEAYRRKHYPEFYEKKSENPPANESKSAAKAEENVEIDPIDQLLEELNSELDDEDAINYFDEEDGSGKPLKKTSAAKKNASTDKPKNYAIPVDVKGSKGKWRIPNN